MRAEELLLSAIREGHAPHAILLTGPIGCDADGLARRAAALHCTGGTDIAALPNCPDYFELGGEGRIGVDSIRELQMSLSVRAFGAGRAVVILGAAQMTESAQNALLKTLEEPPEDVLFLLAGDEAGLLPTIRSRSSIVRLGAMDEDTLTDQLRAEGFALEPAQRAARLSEGAVLLARQLCSAEFDQFYPKALALYMALLEKPVPLPYDDMAALLNAQALPDDGAQRSKTEERRQNAKLCLLVWRQLAREQLESALEYGESYSLLGAGRRHALRNRFTIGQIQDIILTIWAAEKRIAVANPQLAMDALLTELCAPLNSRKDKQA